MEQNFDGVIEVNGEKLHVLFIFENNNKQYVVYKDSLDEISASILGTDGDDIAFYPINTDAEWDLVECELERRNIYGQS